jgi:transglutaminase-like putative cysteine protease
MPAMVPATRLRALALWLLAAGPLPPSAAQEYEVRYHHAVRNRTDRPLAGVRVYLPIPQDDEAQTVRELRIETGGKPLPVSGRHDAFGTVMRRVDLPPLEPDAEVEVGFTCVVTLRPPPRVALRPGRPGAPPEEIPPEIAKRYGGDDPIFGLGTEVVRTAAERLSAEHPEPVARVRAIHDLVAGTFKYAGGDGWDPAPVVLARRSGSCSEFSYAFSALCRATGLPTRFVGASIFPLKSSAPFEDRGWHRWVEVWLPGHGWVPFDPTLDRARPPKQDFVGTRHPRVLVLTRIGSRNTQLGLSYIGSNSHTGQTRRRRWFTWSVREPVEPPAKGR